MYHSLPLNAQGLNIRLRGGQLPSEGRVEVFRTGIWGTVCHNDWDINDANVVCKQLGYGTARKAVRWGEYGQGIVPVKFHPFQFDSFEDKLMPD